MNLEVEIATAKLLSYIDSLLAIEAISRKRNNSPSWNFHQRTHPSHAYSEERLQTRQSMHRVLYVFYVVSSQYTATTN